MEPYHAVTYFAPESREVTTALGCKGGWMSYFALRAAPLGAARQSWSARRSTTSTQVGWPGRSGGVGSGSASAFLAARTQSVDAVLRRLLGEVVDAPEIAEAAELARTAALAAPTAGRPLAAANSVLEWPAHHIWCCGTHRRCFGSRG